MWLILAIYFLSQVKSFTGIKGKITWDVSPKDVKFGTNVTMNCHVQNLDNPRWRVNGLKPAECQKGTCSNNKKYTMRIYDHKSLFSLTIHNFNETDLNVNYICSNGFVKLTRNLTEDHISLFYVPAENSSIDNTVVGKERVNINITVSEIYPVPTCLVTMTSGNKTVVSESKLNVTVLHGSKYRKKVELVGVIKTELEECERRMVVKCHLNVAIVTILQRNITVCQEQTFLEKYKVAIVLLLISVVCLTAFVMGYKKILSRFFSGGDRMKYVDHGKTEQDVNVDTTDTIHQENSPSLDTRDNVPFRLEERGMRMFQRPPRLKILRNDWEHYKHS